MHGVIEEGIRLKKATGHNWVTNEEKRLTVNG